MGPMFVVVFAAMVGLSSIHSETKYHDSVQLCIEYFGAKACNEECVLQNERDNKNEQCDELYPTVTVLYPVER